MWESFKYLKAHLVQFLFQCVYGMTESATVSLGFLDDAPEIFSETCGYPVDHAEVRYNASRLKRMTFSLEFAEARIVGNGKRLEF